MGVPVVTLTRRHGLAGERSGLVRHGSRTAFDFREQLPSLVASLIEQGNFFTGCNPFALLALLRRDPLLAPLVAEVQFLRPWRWQFIGRTYAVRRCGFSRPQGDALEQEIASSARRP